MSWVCLSYEWQQVMGACSCRARPTPVAYRRRRCRRHHMCSCVEIHSITLPQRGSEVFVLISVCFISACKRERVSALRSMGLSFTLCRGEVWSAVGRSSRGDLSKSVVFCQTIIDLNKSSLAGRTLDFSFYSLCESGRRDAPSLPQSGDALPVSAFPPHGNVEICRRCL